MIPVPVELKGLTVTTEHRRAALDEIGFYRRKRASMGYFFDTEDITEQRPFVVSDLLSTVPGVELVGLGRVPCSRRRGCRMKLVVDGFKVDDVRRRLCVEALLLVLDHIRDEAKSSPRINGDPR
jgi:hypothetical protein